MAPKCPYNKGKGLKLCGYGLPGQMFYSLHVPIEEEDSAKSPITAIMKIVHGKASVSKVTTELQYLLKSTWDWQVKRIASDEYMFVVPTATYLDFLTRFQEFKCKINDITVSVERSDFNDINVKREVPFDPQGKKKDDDEDDLWDDEEEDDTDNYDIFADNTKSQRDQTKEILESTKQGEQKGVQNKCGESGPTVEASVEAGEDKENATQVLSKTTEANNIGEQMCMEVCSQEGNKDTRDGPKDPEVEVVEELIHVSDKIQEKARGGTSKVQADADGFQQKKMKISHISQVPGKASARVAGTGTPIQG
jgi:hypothetical protein